MYRDPHKYRKAGLWALALCVLVLVRPALGAALGHLYLLQVVVLLGLPFMVGTQLLSALLEPFEVQFEAQRGGGARVLLTRTNRWGRREHTTSTDLSGYRSVRLRQGGTARGGRTSWLELAPDEQPDAGRRGRRRPRTRDHLNLFPAVSSPEHAALLLKVVQFGLGEPTAPAAHPQSVKTP